MVAAPSPLFEAFRSLTNSDAFILVFATIGPFGGFALYRIQRAIWPQPVHERAASSGGSLFLSETLKDYGYWWLKWQARALVAMRVHPTTVTIGGMLVVWAASACVASGLLGFGGMWILLGSLSDMLDGMVARARNMLSEAGGYVDSMVDRYSDVGLFGGLLVYLWDRPALCAVVLLAAVGATMVSYARAKAESLGVRNVPRGMMQRAERAVYLGFATYFSPVVARHFNAPGDDTPWLAVFVCGLIAVLSNLSALRMSAFVTGALRERDLAHATASR
jgi:CDP-diacylglycerol--glycerol-3-phosphate 3-phosphatidyltransferase